MKDENRKVPRLRFPGFTGDWEQRKLGDICSKIGSGKTPLGGRNSYCDSGVPLIRSQNVNNDRVDLSDVVFINETIDESMSNSRVYKDDVLLNITGASIGRSAVYKGNVHANVNQHVCIIRPHKGYMPDFIQLHLTSENGQKQVELNQAGGGREGLNFQQIGNMYFSFPSIDEQQEIAGFLMQLDKAITLHQRKLDQIKEYKKGMLQKMFPKKGETVPEVRFPGFEGDWEEKKLGCLTDFVTGKAFSANLSDNGSFIVMDMGTVSQEGNRLEKKTTDIKRDVLRKNDLIMPKDDIGGGLIIGKTAYIPKDNQYVLGDHVYRLRFVHDNGLFFHYQINSDSVRKQILPLVTGSAQLGLNSKNIQGVMVHVSSLNEQVIIGKFFKNLDFLITLQQHKINEMKEYKKGLLQQMFV